MEETAARSYPECLHCSQCNVGNTDVADNHSLGLPCGTGCVDDVSRIFVCHHPDRIARWFPVYLFPIAIQAQDHSLSGWQLLLQLRLQEGEISEEAYLAEEVEILDRLRAAREYWQGTGA